MALGDVAMHFALVMPDFVRALSRAHAGDQNSGCNSGKHEFTHRIFLSSGPCTSKAARVAPQILNRPAIAETAGVKKCRMIPAAAAVTAFPSGAGWRKMEPAFA
jgi:hypothetical protein